MIHENTNSKKQITHTKEEFPRVFLTVSFTQKPIGNQGRSERRSQDGNLLQGEPDQARIGSKLPQRRKAATKAMEARITQRGKAATKGMSLN